MAITRINDLMKLNPQDPEFQEASVRFKAAYALRKAREKSGLTQRELGVLAGIPQSAVARIEQGSNVTLESLSKLAIALNSTLTISFS